MLSDANWGYPVLTVAGLAADWRLCDHMTSSLTRESSTNYWLSLLLVFKIINEFTQFTDKLALTDANCGLGLASETSVTTEPVQRRSDLELPSGAALPLPVRPCFPSPPCWVWSLLRLLSTICSPPSPPGDSYGSDVIRLMGTFRNHQTCATWNIFPPSLCELLLAQRHLQLFDSHSHFHRLY